MNKLETLKANIKYYVHYIFDEDNNLDFVFISHSQKVFDDQSQTIELSFDQFQKFPILGCSVQWGNDVMTPNQWIEYWKESNRI